MIITGGKLRSRKLRPIRGSSLRPTSNKVKQAIFNVLGSQLSGAKVLDLFAGTGSLGIEALSRGAEFCTFIDNSSQSLNLIQKNLEHLDLFRNARTFLTDLHKPFRSLFAEQKFDLIFADPPYHLEIPDYFFMEVRSLLNSMGILVFEYSRRNFPRYGDQRFNCWKKKLYGDTGILFLNSPVLT